MSKDIVGTIQEMLKEETWTRTEASKYTESKIEELHALFCSINKENEDEIKNILEEHLRHSRESIAALYLLGMLKLKRGALGNSELERLVSIFKKNFSKDAVILSVLNDIISIDPNNLFALKKLSAYYKNDKNPKLWEIYERIVKLDFEEAAMAKALAEHYEEIAAEKEVGGENGESERLLAVDFYKKAIFRYVNAENMSASKEVWSKLLTLIPDEIDIFERIKGKLFKTFGERVIPFIEELYEVRKLKKDWDNCLSFMKELLTYKPNDGKFRREIVECYKNKYKDHSHLDEYIDSSALLGNGSIFEAINDFEKHVAFDIKSFVYHRSWGVGIIVKVGEEELFINFGKKFGRRKISLKMAVSSLTPLSKDHIWVLKATTDKEKLVYKIKKDPSWALKVIIRSFDNKCTLKKIKPELVPSLLTQKEWTTWYNKAKNILQNDANISVNTDGEDGGEYYSLYDKELLTAEKLTNEFKAKKGFFDKSDVIMRYVNAKDTDKSDEIFHEMLGYFALFLKPFQTENFIGKVTLEAVASLLLLKRISFSLPEVGNQCKVDFLALYPKIDAKEMYRELKKTKNTSLKEDFLLNVKEVDGWADEYLKLFSCVELRPTVNNLEILRTLAKEGYTEKVSAFVANCFENPKDFKEALLLLFESARDEEWLRAANVGYEKQIISLIQLIGITFREIVNHVKTSENRKINESATALLFETDVLDKLFKDNSYECANRIHTLVNDLEDLDPSYKAKLRGKILTYFSDFKFHVNDQKFSAPRGMLVTAKKLEEKKRELENIEKQEIPKNAREIAEARAQGDLKENAEYKAAKEYQHWLDTQATTLRSELDRAEVFDPTTLTTSMVSFATEVRLVNNLTNEEETYTILGPWESNPDNNIISYMAPFGNAIMEKKVGEKVTFTVNDNSYSYSIKEIKAATNL